MEISNLDFNLNFYIKKVIYSSRFKKITMPQASLIIIGQTNMHISRYILPLLLLITCIRDVGMQNIILEGHSLTTMIIMHVIRARFYVLQIVKLEKIS